MKEEIGLKISVITVCLNVENVIERTLLSVFNQTYENFELILIDGASTDGTLDIIKKYKNKISTLVSEPDTGIYNAMNKGVERSCGDFLVFLNAGDEFYDENVLKNVANVIKNNEGVQFVFGDGKLYSEDGLALKVAIKKNINDISSFLRHNFLHQSCYYHKSLFENKKYDETFKISGDSEFNLNYVMKNNFPALYYPAILSKFYLGGVSSIKKTREIMKKEHIRIVHSFYREHPILRIFYDVDNFLKRYFNSILKFLLTPVVVQKIVSFWAKNPKYKLNIQIYNGDKQMKKMNKPKVTIVTITYNLIKAGRKKTFLQCVESVKNQTYENIEHIIIDGASDDGTIDLIKSTGVTYYSEPDNGIYDALNKGILKATGDYVLFLHSDDYFSLNNGIEESVKYLLETNADFSYGSSTFLKKERYAGDFIPVIEMFFTSFPFPHQTMLTKKEVFIKHNLFDTSYKSAGDYDLILRLLLNGAKSVEVPLNFVKFRLEGFSDVNQEQSIKECARLFVENYKQILGCEFDEKTCRNMFCDFIIPKKLIKPIMERVDKDLKIKIEELLATNTVNFDKEHYKIKQHQRIQIDSNKWEKRYIKILNIPFIQIWYMGNKTKIFLFNALPLFKTVDRHGKFECFLFSFLPIWKSKRAA